MNEVKHYLSSRRFEVLLLVLFILVYLSGFTALRLVRDDWSSISNFNRGLSNNPSTFLWDIVTNRWLGLNQSRIFFFSWLVQIAVGFLGRFNYIPYYLFILTWHLFSSVLLFLILREHLRAPAMAAILSCLYLVAPANTNVLFWLNNWFFSIPIFFLLLQIYILSFPRTRSFDQTLLLSLVTILGQFSGEQAIVMFYLSFGIFTLQKLVLYKATDSFKDLIPILFATTLSACALIIYIKWIMNFSVTENVVSFSPEGVRVYLAQFFNFLGQTLYKNSEFYGYSSLSLGTKTIVLTVLEALSIAIVFIYMYSTSDWEMPRMRALLVSVVFVLYALAGLAPCIYGALTGLRPGASWRYLFVPAFPIFGFCLLVCAIILRSFPKYLRRYSTLPLLAFVIYLSFLTTYTLNRIWKFQKGIDQKVWSRIDEVILPIHNSIVTVNLTDNQAQLLPHYYSQAVSDFQADWGVSQRLWSTQHRMIPIGQRVEEIPGSGNLKVIGYYADSSWETPQDSVLFVTYKYGPKFSDLKDAKLHVFAKYSDFKKFMETEKLKKQATH